MATAKLLQSCPTLCDPIEGSPSGSTVPGIFQARTLERVAISFSNAWKWKVKVKLLSRVRLLGTPWTAAYQAPPSMGFSRQEYWSGLPLPSPRRPLWCLNILEELESCRSSIAVPQGGYIFVLKFYCNSPFYPLIKFCWSYCNHLLTSVFVSILSPSVNVKVLVTQLCQTLCDPINCSLTVSSVYGGLQARITEHQHMPMWCCCCSLAAHFRIFFSKLY